MMEKNIELQKAIERIDGVAYVEGHGRSVRVILNNSADVVTINKVWGQIPHDDARFISTQMHAVGVAFELVSDVSLDTSVPTEGGLDD